MALALTCACGAHFEVEETLAGQEVSCPECSKPVRAAFLQRAPLRTSGWALASAILATVGAFTIIGTLAAIVLGVVAVRSIRHNRDSITGTGYAVFGIVAGVVFTGLTVLALTPGELFGLGAWWRERSLRGLVNRSGPLKIEKVPEGYTITRPSPRWGRLIGNVTPEVSLEGLTSGCDLILLDPRNRAYLDVRIETGRKNSSLEQCRDWVLADFEPIDRIDPLGREAKGGYELVREQQLQGGPNYRAEKLIVKTQRIGQAWWFFLDLYKVEHGPLYIVRGYVGHRRLAQAEPDLLKGLESFELLNP